MNIAMAYYHGDRDLAQTLLQWCDEIGSYPNHRLFLFRERGAQPIVHPKNFKSVTETTFTNPYQNEVDERKRWAMSTTQAFQSVARYMGAVPATLEPYLYIEPDCVPTRGTWADEIEAAHKAGGKPFTGAYVPRFGDAPEHMSGVGVYPPNLLKYGAGIALMVYPDAPWDITAGPVILPKANCTPLIAQRWDRPPNPPVQSLADILAIISPEVTLMHGDKGGSWIKVLRGAGGTEARSGSKPASTCSNHAAPDYKKLLSGSNAVTRSTDDTGSEVHSKSSAQKPLAGTERMARQRDPYSS